MVKGRRAAGYSPSALEAGAGQSTLDVGRSVGYYAADEALCYNRVTPRHGGYQQLRYSTIWGRRYRTRDPQSATCPSKLEERSTIPNPQSTARKAVHEEGSRPARPRQISGPLRLYLQPAQKFRSSHASGGRVSRRQKGTIQQKGLLDFISRI